MANYYPSPDFSAATISTTGAGHIGGNFDVATTKFTVAAASGNTAVAGTLAVTGAVTASSTADVAGNFSVATNKFTVAAASGNTVVAGTLAVTGTSTLAAANLSGDVAVATNKFTVAAASGNTAVAGTLGVTGAATLSSTLDVTGNFNVATNKFQVVAASGNTTVAGTLVVTGNLTSSATLVGVNAQFSGTVTTNSVAIIANQLRYNALSPTALSGDTTDWDPATGIAIPVLRVDGGAADRLLYSIINWGQGRMCWLVNVGTTNSITLVHDDGSHGTATGRFLCSNNANYVLYKNSAVLIWYDTVTGRIRVMGAQSVGGII